MMTKTSEYRGGTGLGVLLLLAVLCGALPATAGPQIMTEYGDQMPWYGAEINAMGGAGTALYRGGLSNVFNPALLADVGEARIDAGISLDQEHEDRFQPLFDTFDSWVTDAAIASNRNHFFQSGFSLAGRPVADGLWSLGLSLTDRYPFAYRFDEELRNPSPFPPAQGEPARDAVIAVRQREVTGTLRALSLGTAVDNGQVAFGAAVHYNFGTRTETLSEADKDNVAPNESWNERHAFDMSGINLTVGARVRLNERVDLGLAYESSLTADGDWTRSYNSAAGLLDTMQIYEGSYEYPEAYRAGLTFRPRTDPATVFTIEFEHKPWSKMAVEPIEGYAFRENLRDVTDVRVGLEHTFYNGMPLRFGFRHYNSYADRDAGSAVFSAGTGMNVGKGRLNASLELAKITSVQRHQFDYPSDYFGDNFVVDEAARVEDTRFRIGVGYSREF